MSHQHSKKEDKWDAVIDKILLLFCAALVFYAAYQITQFVRNYCGDTRLEATVSNNN